MRKTILLTFVIATFTTFGQKVRFIPNKGQWNPKALFKAEIPGGDLYLENNRLTYNFLDVEKVHAIHDGSNDSILDCHAYSVRFEGANPNPKIVGEGVGPEIYNYYLGNDPKHWASNLHPYAGVWYKELYPKIDFHIYSKDGVFKYDFVVHPGGNPNSIQLSIDGASKLALLKNGALNIVTTINQVTDEQPVSLQEGKRINTSFVLKQNKLSFKVNMYDKNKLLTIDPTLVFSTYSGSTANNFGFTATYDQKGFLYAGGSVFNTGYPTTLGAYQVNFASYNHIQCPVPAGNCWGISDIGITKYDTSGTKLIYSTYIGGVNCEVPHSLIVNSKDELYVFGTTSSNNYPTTSGAYDQTFAPGGSLDLRNGIYVNYIDGADIVISKLNKNGTALLASTFYGGTDVDGLNGAPDLAFNYADEIRGEIILDENEDVFIATSTRSTDIPMAGASVQSNNAGGQDGILAKFSGDLSTLQWSSYYGGTGDDAIYSVFIGAGNNFYFSGGTNSTNFPTTAAYQNTYGGGRADGFIASLNPSFNIVNSTYYGTSSYDQTYFVRSDNAGNVYVFGQTEDYIDSYVFNATYKNSQSGQYISKFNSSVSALTWSTVFGSGNSSVNISPSAFMVDLCNRVYLTGWGGLTNVEAGTTKGYTTGMPITNDAFQPNSTGSDFYIFVMNDDASGVTYASYYGGANSREHVDGGTSRFNRKGEIYQSVCAGCGGFSDFPIKPNNAWSPINNGIHIAADGTQYGGCNNGVFKFDFEIPAIIADFNVPDYFCFGDSLQFTNSSNVLAGTTYQWDFGDGNSSTDENPKHLYAGTGTYQVKLVVSDPTSCNLIDSITKEVTIESGTSADSAITAICNSVPVTIGVTPSNDPQVLYSWSPQTGLDNPYIANPTVSINKDTTYTLLIQQGTCPDTVNFPIRLDTVSVSGVGSLEGCNVPDSTILSATGIGVKNYSWSSTTNFSSPILTGATEDSLKVAVTNPRSTYYILGEGDYGCRDTDTVYVEEYSFNIDYPNQVEVCFEDSFEIVPQGYLNYDSVGFDWQAIVPLVSDTNDTIAKIKGGTGKYSLVVSSWAKGGCSDKDTIAVTVGSQIPASFIITASPDTTSKFKPSLLTALPSGYSYTWEPNHYVIEQDTNTAVVQPIETTDFSVTVADTLLPNCTRSAQVKVVVIDLLCEEPYIYVPNAFSPNGDGKNDILYVRGSNITKMYFVVYNRWGEKVFESTELTHGWDGYFKGMKIDPAVYDYYLTYECEGGQEHFKKGNITLIR